MKNQLFVTSETFAKKEVDLATKLQTEGDSSAQKEFELISSYEDRIAALQATYEQTIAELRAKIKGSETAFAQKEAEAKKTYELQIRDLDTTFKTSLEALKSSLARELESARMKEQQTAESYKSRISQLESDYKQTFDQLNLKIKQLSDESSKKDVEMKNISEDKVAKLEKTYKSKVEELQMQINLDSSIFEDKERELKKKLEQLSSTHEKYKGETGRQLQELRKEKEELDKIRGDLSKNLTTARQAQVEVADKLTKENMSLLNEIQALRKEVSESHEKLKKLTAEHIELKNRKPKREGDETLIDEIGKLHDKNIHLIDSLEDARQQLNDMENRFSKTSIENQELSAQLRRCAFCFLVWKELIA